MRIWPVALLLAACGSSRDRTPVTVEQPGRVTSEAELAVTRAVGAPAGPPVLLLELGAPGPTPVRLGRDFREGRSWLRVERPRGFSFAARELLGGDRVFRPLEASLLFVQPRQGPAHPLEPALFRLGGSLPTEQVAARVEAVDDPGTQRDELGRVRSEDVRVLLGRGADGLLACVGSGEMDVHEWVAVLDEAGAPATWLPALASASSERSLAPLAPYRVIVRRRRAGDPVPAHFRLRLDDVVVASQMHIVPRRDTVEWVWEGVWSAHLIAAPAATGDPAWPPEAPPLQIRYKEYVRPSGNVTGTFWRGLLAPLALGADVGMAFLEGDEPLIDSVAERQRARN